MGPKSILTQLRGLRPTVSNYFLTPLPLQVLGPDDSSDDLRFVRVGADELDVHRDMRCGHLWALTFRVVS